MIYCVISKQGCLLGVFSCYQDAHIVAKRQGATVQQCSLNSECGIDAPVCRVLQYHTQQITGELCPILQYRIPHRPKLVWHLLQYSILCGVEVVPVALYERYAHRIVEI